MRRPSELLKRLRSSPFLKGVGTVAIGTAVGQGFTLAVAPLLTRVYTPADFAVYGLFTSFAGFAAVAVCLRYELAIASTQRLEDVRPLTIASLALVLVMTPLGVLVFQVLVSAELLGFGGFPSWGAVALGLGLAFVGSGAALRYGLVQREKFGVIAGAPVSQNFTRGIVHIGSGLAGLGGLGLVIGEVVGRVATTVHVWLGGRPWFPSHGLVGGKSDGSWGTEVLAVLRRYSQYPKYALPSSLLDALAVAVLTPLFVVFHGEQDAGRFFLVQRVVTLPVGFVVVSVADVFHGRLARLGREDPGGMLPFFFRTSRMLGGLGLAFGLALVLASPPAFRVIFGEEWASAGLMAALMAPWAASQLVVGPLSRLIFVVDAQRAKLVIDVAMLLATVAAFLSADALGMGVLGTVAAVSVGQAGVYLAYFLLLWLVLARWVDRSSSSDGVEETVP